MTDTAVPLLTLNEVRDVLRAHRSIVISTHVNPDGDAIGSEYALAHYLRGLGKRVDVLNTSPLPENLQFLGGDGLIRTFDPARDTARVTEADLIVVVDLNDASRLRSMAQTVLAAGARKIVIDHHLEPKPFANGYHIDPTKCATAEILYDLLTLPGAPPLSAESALGLYVGVMTDTGSFRFDRTTPRVHRIAAELLEHGVDPVSVYRRVYDEYPLRRSRLLGMILAGIEPVAGGRATILTVTREMFADTGTTLDDVENIVNYGLGIHGVEATALLTELEGEVKISFRSRGEVSIHQVAKTFGGGGHMYAAGATVSGKRLAEVKDEVASALGRLFKGDGG
jgi:bifunctional oligoribonuclease and PAP phosphatase NrnA